MTNVATLKQEQQTRMVGNVEMKRVFLKDVFAPFVPQNIDTVIEIPVQTTKHVPRAVEGYIPDVNLLRRAVAWFFSQHRPNFFHTYGPTGSGKTDFWLWFAARCNWPVHLVTVTPSLRPDKMQGRWMLKDGETSYSLGPVAMGMTDGGIVLLDEADKGSLDFIAKMHLPAEMTKPWSIEDTGETIYPNENFRFITTGNTNGQGDTNGLYPSSRRWDTAFRNRAYVVPVQYVEPQLEMDIIEGRYPEFRQYRKTTKSMIKFANAMRDAMLGPSRKGDIASPLGTAFSTRILLNWCYYIVVAGINYVPLRETLETTFMNGIDDKDRDAIEKIANQVFNGPNGHVLDNPCGWLESLGK
ncbi:AAA family ATPase [Enterovibrio norvegicus]|uniref:AAA family ATPase n=1 Tax=Enterovibrio norvegicus TaxID=188144 RepID=UPI00352D1A43